MDLLPTITELCLGKPSPSQHGQSLAALVKGAGEPTDRSVISTWFTTGRHMSVRNRRYRYIKYADGSDELYDHFNDPDEHINLLRLAGNTASYAGLIAEFKAALGGQT